MTRIKRMLTAAADWCNDHLMTMNVVAAALSAAGLALSIYALVTL